MRGEEGCCTGVVDRKWESPFCWEQFIFVEGCSVRIVDKFVVLDRKL